LFHELQVVLPASLTIKRGPGEVIRGRVGLCVPLADFVRHGNYCLSAIPWGSFCPDTKTYR